MSIHLAFLIVLCNMLSWQASKMLTSLFAISLGAPQFYIGTIIATYSVFPLLLAFYAGKLSDRLGVRTPMLFGSAGVATAIALPGVFPGLPALYVSAALIGACHVFYNVAVQNLIGLLSDDKTRTRNYSNFTLVISVSGMLGPLAAGFSIDHFGHVATYLCLAGVPLISVFALLFFARKVTPQTADSAKTEKPASDGKSLLTNPPLRRVVIAGGIVVTGHDLFNFYMPIYGHAIGLSASTIGVVISCFAVAAFGVRVMLPAIVKRTGEEVLLLWAIFLSAAIYLMVPFFATAPLLAMVAFVLGLTLGCCAPLAMSLIYTHAPQGRSGEALGLRLTVNNVTHVAVPVLFGALGTFLGVAPVFIANSLLLAGGGMLVMRPGKP